MTEKFDIKKLMGNAAEKVTDLLAKLIKCIRKTDKRTLMIGAGGAFIALVLIIVIIASAAGGKKEDNKNDTPVSSDSYITEESSTDEEPTADSLNMNGLGFYIVATDSESPLNMRPTAGKDYGIIAKIPNGTRVEVLFIDDSDSENTQKGWGYIEYNGNRGWVSMDYLKVVG